MILYIARDQIYDGLFLHESRPVLKDRMYLSLGHIEANAELKVKYANLKPEDGPIKLQCTFTEVQ